MSVRDSREATEDDMIAHARNAESIGTTEPFWTFLNNAARRWSDDVAPGHQVAEGIDDHDYGALCMDVEPLPVDEHMEACWGQFVVFGDTDTDAWLTARASILAEVEP